MNKTIIIITAMFLSCGGEIVVPASDVILKCEENNPGELICEIQQEIENPIKSIKINNQEVILECAESGN